MGPDQNIWFFAGGDHGKGDLNLFTGSFINFMTERYGSGFRLISGIYNRYPFLNVVWGLTHAQKPLKANTKNRILHTSCRQILSDHNRNQSGVHIVSSSYGSVVAAQVACCLARKMETGKLETIPLNVALGATMISKHSLLYKALADYHKKGFIKKLVYDELQDAGDNAMGIGGQTRFGAYLRGFGICFPFLTLKYKGPSFLNKNPKTGHLHRKRAQSVEKARDFMRVMDGFVSE